MPLVEGSRFGRFRILARAGRGGMGEVYRAEDATLGRVVALKTIRRGTLADASASLAGYSVARFEREARVLAAFAHPNAVAIYGFEVIEDTAVLVMEWIEGRSLHAVIREGRASLEERLRWLGEAAGALAALHRAGIVHRDLKPANMIVDATGRLRLLDFGVARVVEDGQGAPLLTGTHEVLGTPKYMAPEQRLGARVDGRADQFAWGLVAYELLTGRHPRDVSPEPHPFPATPPAAPNALEPRLAPELGAVVLRALALSPDDRFPSMDGLAAALAATPSLTDAAPLEPAADTIREPPRHAPRARRPWLVFLASGGAAIAIGAAGLAALVHRGVLGDAAWRAAPPAPPAPLVVDPPPDGADASDATDADDDGASAGDDADAAPDDAPPLAARTLAGIRALERPDSVDPGAFDAWLRAHERAALRCYQRFPPDEMCPAQSFSCAVDDAGAVSECTVIRSVRTISHPDAKSCVESDERGACLAPLFASASPPTGLAFGRSRSLRFRIAPRWRAAAKPRADRVRVETVDAREIRPASSERAVRAWIDTRRASLLECYRAHAAAAACADSMTVTYDCVVTPDGAAEHCAAVDFIFDIRRPECGFGVEGSLCVARALDGSKGPLPFGADSIAVTLHPR